MPSQEDCATKTTAAAKKSSKTIKEEEGASTQKKGASQRGLASGGDISSFLSSASSVLIDISCQTYNRVLQLLRFFLKIFLLILFCKFQFYAHLNRLCLVVFFCAFTVHTLSSFQFLTL